MEFRTSVILPKNGLHITHNDNLLLMGSCFAGNIGELLLENKFNCDVNPFGILYNPLSLSTALREMISGTLYNREHLFFYGGQYHSYMHHGSFSAASPEEALELMNVRLEKAHRQLPKLNMLILTLGTAWVYTLIETGKVVANCHKLPARNFTRRRLSVEEIVEDYTNLLADLKQLNPTLKVIMTVSPIRHLKDGLHENQLSKSTLLLAIARLQELFSETILYFPSYEIVVDELRDYRFYGDDMVHPSSIAIQYLWECFSEVFFSADTQQVIKEWKHISKALKHKPFREDSEEYKRFLGQIVLNIERLKEKYPNLDVQKELNLCHTRLK
ncbi:GSCFA domain-containing protein [Bacteroides sp. 224]|uniref:GSCFA domain-containing protein n=1 Tax=Bacteroides sp. 224 TaxID=2302936 RepID=UPI0013D7CE29|nr:GSCFA domain-containing protein [Bacteroides sp. 224]NDV67020.1 GSCFA domain protein [Bacteroides sp. 224]